MSKTTDRRTALDDQPMMGGFTRGELQQISERADADPMISDHWKETIGRLTDSIAPRREMTVRFGEETWLRIQALCAVTGGDPHLWVQQAISEWFDAQMAATVGAEAPR